MINVVHFSQYKLLDQKVQVSNASNLKRHLSSTYWPKNVIDRLSFYAPWPKRISNSSTDSTKINPPEHNIRMYWTNFRQRTTHVQPNIFGKTLIEVCSLHLYASFGTFCVQIGQLFAPQWVFKHSEEFRNRRHFPSKAANCRFSNIL